MAGARRMLPGLASGAVTVAVALFLLMSTGQRRQADVPPPPPADRPTAPPPLPADIVLPPPPAPKPAPGSVPAPVKLPPVAANPAPGSVPAPVKLPPVAAKPAAKPPPPAPRKIAPPLRAAATPVPVAPATVTAGRTLLRLLESGKGPSIVIAWPASATARARLYRLLGACYGMRTMILAGGNALFGADGPPGRPIRVNRDLMSGFMRRPEGAVPPAERALVARIRARNGLSGGTPVRLFPRTVDAALLGALSAAVGPGYLSHGHIRARYRLAGDAVAVDRIEADGRQLPGAIALPEVGGPDCR